MGSSLSDKRRVCQARDEFASSFPPSQADRGFELKILAFPAAALTTGSLPPSASTLA
jgi:hypothetical protein